MSSSPSFLVFAVVVWVTVVAFVVVVDVVFLVVFFVVVPVVVVTSHKCENFLEVRVLLVRVLLDAASIFRKRRVAARLLDGWRLLRQSCL